MNGRIYDYQSGRFLSVDPFISMPGSSQAYNPYSYVMNNPLSYTDPTGYFIQDLSTKSQSSGGAQSSEAGQNKPEECNTSCIDKKARLITQSLCNSGGKCSVIVTDNGAYKKYETIINTSENQNTNTENSITQVNLGVAVGGVTAGLAEVSNADILRPKKNVIHHKNPTLNKPRIGVAKNADEVLFGIKDTGKAVAKKLAFLGVAISTAEAIVDIRNPSLSENQKIGSGLKAGTDVSIILVSATIGGPVGLGVAVVYLITDYIFDFKSGIQKGVDYYRREEENQ